MICQPHRSSILLDRSYTDIFVRMLWSINQGDEFLTSGLFARTTHLQRQCFLEIASTSNVLSNQGDEFTAQMIAYDMTIKTYNIFYEWT